MKETEINFCLRNYCLIQRYTMKRFLIHSALRSSGTPYNFWIRLPANGLLRGAYVLKAVNMFNSAYNVTSSNNQFAFNDGVDRAVSVTAGSYDIVTLCSALQTAINAVSTLTWTVTFSSVTWKVTFSATNSFSLDFTVANSMATSLGMTATVHASASNAVVGDSIIGLSASPLNFHIDLVQGSHDISIPNGHSSTFVVPVTSLSQSQNYYEPTQGFCQSVYFENDVQMLQVHVTDHANADVVLQNDWSMILERC